jgi:hypothetical protein
MVLGMQDDGYRAVISPTSEYNSGRRDIDNGNVNILSTCSLVRPRRDPIGAIAVDL